MRLRRRFSDVGEGGTASVGEGSSGMTESVFTGGSGAGGGISSTCVDSRGESKAAGSVAAGIGSAGGSTGGSAGGSAGESSAGFVVVSAAGAVSAAGSSIVPGSLASAGSTV